MFALFFNFQNSNDKRYPILKRKCYILLNGKSGEITISLPKKHLSSGTYQWANLAYQGSVRSSSFLNPYCIKDFTLKIQHLTCKLKTTYFIRILDDYLITVKFLNTVKATCQIQQWEVLSIKETMCSFSLGWHLLLWNCRKEEIMNIKKLRDCS